jgi:PAS domain S-box-containing protein
MLRKKVKELKTKHQPVTKTTQYRNAIDELEQLHRHHELILQSVGEGVYGLDCNGHTTFVNEVARKMLGWELSELITKPQHDIIHHTKPDGSHYEAKDCAIYAAFKDGKVHRIDDEIFWRKDGTSFPVEYISTPIKDESGKLLGAVVAFKDITLKKEAERTLQKSNADLQNALAEVERLKVRLEEENKYLQQEIKYSSNFEEIISRSKKFKHILTQIERVAPTSSTVLILGETGTGKELIARAIHNIGKRRDRVLVKVNCAALPSSLIESELFGHEKGAFTGAIAKKIGRFELANGGTIFLDEIGEIPLELQPKLLRVLQEGEFERLGNSQTIKVDVRIIAATNIDLQEAVNNGEFREDLFYRLNVFPVNVIPLRERKEDIPLLANHFLLKLSTRIGKHINIITNKTMDELINYNWPGNIRELENIIERSVIITQGNKLNLSDSLSSSTIKFNNEEITTIEENEKNHILRTLELTNWKISGDKGAAKILGIKRTTLEARIKKLNIKRL